MLDREHLIHGSALEGTNPLGMLLEQVVKGLLTLCFNNQAILGYSIHRFLRFLRFQTLRFSCAFFSPISPGDKHLKFQNVVEIAHKAVVSLF